MVRNLVSVIAGHWLSLVGAIIALAALVMMLTLIGIQLSGFSGGAYLGILTYMLLPMAFALGLVLVPLGVWRRRKLTAVAMAHHETPPPALPVIDLNNERTRGIVLASVVVGLLSTVLLAGVTYKGVHEMESVAFCGTVCHTVMQPEHTAFQRSSHSKITCADCHIGAGADWFVKSKITGSWQMVSVAFGLYPTPIGTPVHSLRPARDTCEQCHWPTRHVGDTLKIKTNFASDEANAETKTVLLMKVGGQQGSTSSGIHWHVDRGVSIRFLTDRSRQNVFDIEMSTADGKKKSFKTNAKPEGPTEWRSMDCVDCHNRPAHTFQPANKEVNAAMESGRIDKTLPFVKKEALRVLTEGKFASHEAARAGIVSDLTNFYKTRYPEVATAKAAQIAAAGAALGDIYAWNVFPKMKVTWGTYANHLGHSEESPGCLRCHDKKHVSEDGGKVSGSCKTCHAVLADDEPNPDVLKVLKP
jgi:hypothetical protein